MMDNIERVYSGLREINRAKLKQPDFILAIDENDKIPEKISGIPVIISPTAFTVTDHGTNVLITCFPCYLIEKNINYEAFQAYKRGWDNT